MPRGRYIRLKTRQPDQVTLARYLLIWNSAALHTQPEMFPRIASPALFGNDHPLELEVGSGTGEFLCELAARTPGCNYVGVDTSRKALFVAVERAAARGLANIKFIKADIKLVYPLLLPNRLRSVYLHFPLPDIQARHRRRGVLSQSFVDHMHHALVPGGRLSVITDEEAVFRQLVSLTRVDPRFETVYDRQQMLEIDEGLKSNYQRLWERFGRTVLRLELRTLPK